MHCKKVKSEGKSSVHYTNPLENLYTECRLVLMFLTSSTEGRVRIAPAQSVLSLVSCCLLAVSDTLPSSCPRSRRNRAVHTGVRARAPGTPGGVRF